MSMYVSGKVVFAGFCASKYDVVRRHRLTVEMDDETKEKLKGTNYDGKEVIYLTSNNPFYFTDGKDWLSPNVISKIGKGTDVTVACEFNENGWLEVKAVRINEMLEREKRVNPFEEV